MITVSLNWNEVEMAADVGKLRFIIPIRQENRNRYGATNSWDNDITSCIAEMAVAKYSNQYWHASPAIESKKITNDVGESLEVRTSRTNKLLVRSGDKDDRIYFGVSWPKWTKDGCSVNLLGGMLGKEAKQDKWLETFGNNRPPVFAVPPGMLIPPEEIFKKEG